MKSGDPEFAASLSRFSALVLALIVCGTAVHAAEPSKYHALQQHADSLYDQGDYGAAMKQYLALAKRGDTFSQYRVSYMYLEGQGLPSDVIESFAWASLSAQNYQKDLVLYRNIVSSLVPGDEQRKAARRVDYYMRRWGNRAIAQDAVKGARRELRDCTGSRLGTRCEEIYAAEMPTFWSVNPGDGSNPGSGGRAGEGDGGTALPSGALASPQGSGGGGLERDVRYYRELRQKIRDMNAYIEEATGNVTITDVDDGESQPAQTEEPDDR